MPRLLHDLIPGPGLLAMVTIEKALDDGEISSRDLLEVHPS